MKFEIRHKVTGGIIYKTGEKYSVENANTDETNQCAAGINLATLDWCIKEWKEGVAHAELPQ